MIKIFTIVAIAALAPMLRTKPMTAVGATRAQWEEVAKFVTTAAEQMPESSYSYKPTPAVRSFGELIGHIAGTQDLMCASILGQKAPAEDAIEKSATTKAALVAAMKASNEHCAKAYAISDAAAAKSVNLFGVDRTGLYWLMSNTAHDNLHYGNVITYMRMLNMVPPSSQPAPKS